MGDIAKPLAKITSDLDQISKEVTAVARRAMGADAAINGSAVSRRSNVNMTANGGGLAAVRKRTKSMSASAVSRKDELLEKPPLYWAIMAYISYIFLVVTGYVRELIWGIGPIDKPRGREFGREGYAPLYSSFEGFYTRNIFRRYKPVVGQVITTVPGARLRILQHSSDDYFWTSRPLENSELDCVNLGSYNYLGYAENSGPCTDSAIGAITKEGLTSSSSRHELGTMPCHQELEKTVAEFVGCEAAMTCGMGFATNSLNIPCLFSKGCLILSDELNHASLILGMRLSGATVMVFKHGNIDHLERLLRSAIIRGHPRSRRPWKKIIIVVEGVYSMEGTIARLPEIVALKKKYGAYIYLDEAHSVGAMGPNGRGVVDYFGLDPKDIDIMMGTFTKSFGSAGGYIAGSRKLIDYLRVNSQAFCYPTSVSPPVAMQVVASMQQIMNKEGAGLQRIRQLADNSKYFRQGLKQLGLIVYGDDDSPVIPVLLIMPAKIRAFVEYLKGHGVATVTVGFPAVPMTMERARFCMSSSLSKADLDMTLKAMDIVATELNLRYSQIKKSQTKLVYGNNTSSSS